MSEHDLTADVDFANLPEDAEECFILIEESCRRNAVLAMRHADNNNDLARITMLNYMAVVSECAKECGIENLSYDHEVNVWDEYGNFIRQAQAVVARIKLRKRRGGSSTSVQLTITAKSKIEFQINKLRRLIADADISDERKKHLDKKLDDLIRDVNGSNRISLGKVMVTLAAVTTAMAGLTTLAADGPQAIRHILEVIGAEKQTEEDAIKRLAPPPRLLTASTEAKKIAGSGRVGQQSSRALDDDIPF